MADTQIAQKTGTSISQVIGISMIAGFGALAAAGFWFLGTSDTKSTKTVSGLQSTDTTTTVDLTKEAILVESDQLSAEAYAQAVAESAVVTATATPVDIVFTTPTEGAIVTGNTSVAVEVDDPNNLVKGVRFETFNDRHGYHFIWGFDGTKPYGFTPNLGLYPSGEYRHVALAKDGQGNTIATKDVMVTFGHTCYYLGYQDMTIDKTSVDVVAGKSFQISGTVTNKMRGACQNIYSLKMSNAAPGQLTMPDGWTVTFNPASLTLGIGATGTFTATVNVPATAPTQTHSLKVTSNRQGTGFTVDKTFTANVTARTSGGGGGGGTEPLETL